MISKAKAKGLPARPLSLTTPLATLLPVIGAGNSNRIYRAEEAPASTETQPAPLLTQPLAQPAALFSQFMPIIPPLSPSPDNPVVDPPSPELPTAFGVVLPAPPADLFHALAGTPQAPLSQTLPHLSELHRHLSEPLILRALASEPQQHLYEVAFQTGPELLDLNQDTVITSQDAQVLYYFALLQEGTIDQATLTTLLNNLSGTTLSTDALIALNLLGPTDANPPPAISELDLNNDGVIDLQDVRILYYAYRFGDILQASPSLRETLLSDLTGTDTQDEYMRILADAASLRPPVPTGDHMFQVIEGASYTLSTDDLSARDPDDADAALIWTLTSAPMDGRLELRPGEGAAVVVITTTGENTTFTQADVDADRVVYVHVSGDAEDSFEVRVANPDDPGPAGAVTLNVEVFEPTNPSPTEVTLRNPVASLDENTVARTLVAEIAVNDDHMGPRMLELVGDDAGLFELNGAQTELFLRAGQALDFEGANTQLDVTVQVMGSSPAVNADLSITLNDVDDAPTAVTLSNQMTTLDENTVTRTKVADIAVTDVDDGPRMLELVGDDAGLFELNGAQTELFLRAGQALDFEGTNNQLDVTVQVMGSSPAVSADLSITLNDVDDAPTAVTLSNQMTTLDENTVTRTKVADIAVTDVDDGPRMLELVGDDAGLFELNGAQTELFLRAGQALDFEGANTQLDVTVQVMGSSPAVSADLSITLNDVDDAPTAVTLSNQMTTLDENTVTRTKVADIAVTDVDDGPRMLELVGDDAGLFELNGAQTELFLRAGQALDFEGTNTQLDVTVQVMGSSPAVSADLSITLNDVDDAPTAVTLSNQMTTLDENTVTRTKVADIAVTDVDDGPRMLELVGDDAGLFELNGAQTELFLRAGQALDFEGANTQLDVTVQVMGSSPAVSADLSITLNDVDDAPTAVTLSNQMTTLDENTVTRTKVADIAVTDVDDGPRMLELVGDDAGLFELNGAQTELFLRAGQALDFEGTNTQLDVTVQVMGSSPAVSADLSITLNDVDDAPTAVTLSNQMTTLDENTVTRTKVADIAVTDVDDGPRMLELVGDDAGLFELNGAQTELFLRAGQALDFEGANTQLDVTVQVMGSSPAVNADLSITLNDVDDAPTAVTLSNQMTTLDENTVTRTKVADIAVTDVDDGPRMLELVGDDAGLFELNGAQTELFLRAGQALDFEGTNNQLDVTVQVMGSSPAVSADLSITLNDVDDAPTAVTLSNQMTTLDENTVTRTKVADIAVTDVDDGPRMLELVGDDAGLFVLNTDQDMLFLRAGQALDFEGTNTQLDVTVQVMGNPGVNAPLSIPVNDVNDAPTTAGDSAIEVAVGASYRLTTDDLLATDEDESDSPAQLTWRVITGSEPASGRLAFLDTSEDAMSFTQADVDAGRVVYIHDGSETTSDSFEVRVEDDEGERAEPVMLSVAVNTPTNMLPTAVTLTIQVPELAEDADTSSPMVVAGIDVTDTEGGEMLELTGDDAGLFEFNGDQTQLLLRADAGLDFETNPSLDVTVHAVRDPEGVSAGLSIPVTDVNEAPTVGGTLELVVGEGGFRALSQNVLSAMDEDAGDVLTWEVVTMGGGEPMHGILSFEVSSLDPDAIMTFSDVQRPGVSYIHDGSETTSDSFVVRVMDDDGERSEDVTVLVTVNPVDDPPTRIEVDFVLRSFREDTNTRTKVADIIVTDDDGGTNQLQLVGDDSELFELSPDGKELFLRAGVVLDHETREFLGIRVIDVLSEVDTRANFAVIDVNEAPTTSGDARFSVTQSEDYMLRTDDLSATDQDDTDGPEALTWTVTGMPGNGRLELRPVSGPIMTIAMDGTFTQAQLEAGEVFYVHTGVDDSDDSFTLQVADDDGETASAPVELTVNVFAGGARPPTEVTLMNPVTELPEDTNTRTKVADIMIEDPDGGVPVLVLTGDDAALFELGTDSVTGLPNELFLRAGAGLDFDLNPELAVTVQVMGNPGVNAPLSITITDVPEAPTTSGDARIEVNEGENYMLTPADLAAMDGDASDGPEQLTWTVTAPPREGFLALAGALTTAITEFTQAQLAAEQVFYVHAGEETSEADSVTLQVRDDGGLPAASVTLDVAVTAVNDPPTIIGDDSFELSQGTSYVLTTTDLSARDPDDDAATLTWTLRLAPMNGRLAFRDTPDVAITTFTQAQLEAGDVFYIHTGADDSDDSFTVEVSDGEAPAVMRELTVTVTPPAVNSPPSAVSLTLDPDFESGLSEDTDTSMPVRVADIAVTDTDGGDRGLVLTGADAGLFQLNGAQTELFLRAGATLDFETNRNLDVAVSVESNPVATDALSIMVTDANDAPTNVFPSGIFTVRDGENHVLSMEALLAMDEDADDGPEELTWIVVDQPEDGRLARIGMPEEAISSFTQTEINAGQIVYVYTGNIGVFDERRDSFQVQVQDNQETQASSPVGFIVTITSAVTDLSEDLPEGDGFIIQGDAAYDYAGYDVSDAGDVNGDGFADLIVGALRGDDGGLNAGEAYVVFGKSGGIGNIDLAKLSEDDGFIIQGDTENVRAGARVSGAGDVNGDGFADLLVGAPGTALRDGVPGEAYLVFGKATGFGAPRMNMVEGEGSFSRQVVRLSELSPDEGFILQLPRVGGSIASGDLSGVGDVNGDGFADLLIGLVSESAFIRGAYVVFGKSSGFGDLVAGREVLNAADLTEMDGFFIQGGNFQVGYSVSGAGDVDGDGFADLIIGAPGGDAGGLNAGEAYVVFGKASGFGSAVSFILEDGSMGTRRLLDLGSLEAGDGFTIQGDSSRDFAGASVSDAGDVNGDGYADLIIGAPRGEDGGGNVGEAYVVFGDGERGFGTLNPDTSRRLLDLTELSAQDGFIIQGDSRGGFAGQSVSGAGDVNGDGFDDLLVGAPYSLAYDNGEAYVVFGKADGFGSADSAGRRVVDLSGLAQEDGFFIRGDAENDYAGRSVSGAGDINGDGYADLIVGAHRADVSTSGGVTRRDAGEVYVLFGGPAGLTTEAGALQGTNSGDGDLNDDGAARVVLAGAGDDVLNIDGFGDTDLLKFDGGSGTDTLRFNGVSLALDLSELADTRLSSIERIDLSGGGSSNSNGLSLTRLDLLSLSEVRTDGRAELRVDGNAGDGVSAGDTGWMFEGTQEIDTVTYNVFDNGNARLLVNIAVSLGDNLAITSPATMSEIFQNYYAMAHTVDVRALIDALPPEDEEQQRKRMEDELAMLGPLPAARAALEAEQPAAVAEPDTDLFDLPILNPDDGM